MDILHTLQSQIISLVGSGLFIISCWIAWQIWIFRKQQTRDQAILAKLADIEKQLQHPPTSYSISIDSPINDVGSGSVSVSAPSMMEVETLIRKYSITPKHSGADESEQIRGYSR